VPAAGGGDAGGGRARTIGSSDAAGAAKPGGCIGSA
jgi:hypothetical protein